eukprot:5250437-Pyramimonas_sp.AAC.1
MGEVSGWRFVCEWIARKSEGIAPSIWGPHFEQVIGNVYQAYHSIAPKGHIPSTFRCGGQRVKSEMPFRWMFEAWSCKRSQGGLLFAVQKSIWIPL